MIVAIVLLSLPARSNETDDMKVPAHLIVSLVALHVRLGHIRLNSWHSRAVKLSEPKCLPVNVAKLPRNPATCSRNSRIHFCRAVAVICRCTFDRATSTAAIDTRAARKR